MEVLPHFWITFYNENLNIIRDKKINTIIHLSKFKEFIKKDNIEELRIPIDYNNEQSYEEQNNIMYQHLFDITNYIHDKIINNNNILLIGEIKKQDIDTIIIAYFIRYGKLNIANSIIFLKTKKDDIFSPKCFFYAALNKFYNEINK